MQTIKKLFIKKSIAVRAPAKNVWRVIVSANMWSEWMLVAPERENKKSLGLGSRVLWKNENGKVYLTGTVTVFEPNKKLVFELKDVSWRRQTKPGEVTYAFILFENNGMTHLEFSLGDLSIDPEAKQWFEAYKKSRELERIKALAEKLTI